MSECEPPQPPRFTRRNPLLNTNHQGQAPFRPCRLSSNCWRGYMNPFSAGARKPASNAYVLMRPIVPHGIVIVPIHQALSRQSCLQERLRRVGASSHGSRSIPRATMQPEPQIAVDSPARGSASAQCPPKSRRRQRPPPWLSRSERERRSSPRP